MKKFRSFVKSATSKDQSINSSGAGPPPASANNPTFVARPSDDLPTLHTQPSNEHSPSNFSPKPAQKLKPKLQSLSNESLRNSGASSTQATNFTDKSPDIFGDSDIRDGKSPDLIPPISPPASGKKFKPFEALSGLPAATKRKMFSAPQPPPSSEKRPPTPPPANNSMTFDPPTPPPASSKMTFSPPTPPPASSKRTFSPSTPPPASNKTTFDPPTPPPASNKTTFDPPTPPPASNKRAFDPPTPPPASEGMIFNPPTPPSEKNNMDLSPPTSPPETSIILTLQKASSSRANDSTDSHTSTLSPLEQPSVVDSTDSKKFSIGTLNGVKRNPSFMSDLESAIAQIASLSVVGGSKGDSSSRDNHTGSATSTQPPQLPDKKQPPAVLIPTHLTNGHSTGIVQL